MKKSLSVVAGTTVRLWEEERVGVWAKSDILSKTHTPKHPHSQTVNYADAEAFLLALPRFADQGSVAFKPGLERMRTVLAAMDAPHRAYPSLHVAGTNGKGSTASMLASIATASGRKTGLHTSPHLLYLGERMRLGGVPAPEAWI